MDQGQDEAKDGEIEGGMDERLEQRRVEMIEGPIEGIM
jgi:hypothetical protein